MWVAFIFFGSPAKIYLIEGDDRAYCGTFLKNTFGLDRIDNFLWVKFMFDYLKINFKYYYNLLIYYINILVLSKLLKILKLFNVTEEIFQQPQTDPLYFRYGKDDQAPKMIRAVDGEFCKICKNFYPMAVANQPDNSMVCWSCRDSRGWMFQ